MHDRIRAWLAPWRHTPVHPQWFSFRDESGWLRHWAGQARGLVVEVGCGRQRIAPFLGADCRYVGTDYPTTATSLYDSRPHAYADARALPFADGAVDTVLMLEVLEHVPDPERAMREANRVLRTGGRLILSVPFLYPVHDAPFDFTRWTPAGVRELAARFGFEVEEWRAVGSPAQTAALLANIAIARLCMTLLRRWHLLAAPFVLVAAPVVPLVNLLGWAFHLAARDDELMPHACRAICRKARGPR